LAGLPHCGDLDLGHADTHIHTQNYPFSTLFEYAETG